MDPEKCMWVDVTKRAGWVGFGSDQSGLRVKRVTGQNRSIGLRVGLGLPVFFKQVFFFFFFSITKTNQ